VLTPMANETTIESLELPDEYQYFYEFIEDCRSEFTGENMPLDFKEMDEQSKISLVQLENHAVVNLSIESDLFKDVSL